jgi:5'(3')-deoxyribonucleotidase
MNRIAQVDMDATLCDYAGAMNKKLKEILGEEADWMDPKYKKVVDLIKLQPGFWKGLKPIPSGFKVVNLLQDNGFQVNILTKGPYRTISAWSEKVEWCRFHLPGVPVTITENKGLVYGRILVDDWPPYCQQWLEWRPRGLVLMPSYPYNKNFSKDYPGQVVYISEDNWANVESAIQSVAIRKVGEPLIINQV